MLVLRRVQFLNDLSNVPSKFVRWTRPGCVEDFVPTSVEPGKLYEANPFLVSDIAHPVIAAEACHGLPDLIMQSFARHGRGVFAHLFVFLFSNTRAKDL